MANRQKIRPCYSTNNAADQTQLKIGLINIRSLAPKATLVNELITDHQVEILCVTETGLKLYIALNESTPPGYSYTHVPRLTGSGGGVAAVYHFNFFAILKSGFRCNFF
uniref:Endonuclease/exonuclease/phosphatase domain-containing protein n=1 Tax=Anguilla anguilla TaxID=7936 RepID=A0A0E9WC84_ANGAN